MKTIERTFYSLPVSLLFFTAVPLFYFLFILAYQPFGIEVFLAADHRRYTLNLIIASLCVLGVMLLSRLLLFLLRRRIDLNWPLYVLWCTSEVVASGLFISIPLGIGWAASKTYFTVMSLCVLYTAGILVYPLALLSMGVQLYVIDQRGGRVAPVDEKKLIRFHDDKKRLKLVVASEAVLYIGAEDNYVHIVHLDNDRVRDFVLRSSMRALEDLLQRHGLVRCHRSFFINPERVEILRKDENGYFQACLDREGLTPIPVSKRYYDALAQKF